LNHDQYDPIGLGESDPPEFLNIERRWLSRLWGDFVDGIAHAQTTVAAPLLLLDAACRHEVTSMIVGYRQGLLQGITHTSNVQFDDDDDRFQVFNDWDVSDLVPSWADHEGLDHLDGEPIAHEGTDYYCRIVGLDGYFENRLVPARIKHSQSLRQMEPTLRYIRQAAILRAWSSLEAFTQDVWVEALNNLHPNFRDRCVNGVMSNDGLESVEGLDGRSISLKILKKHNFDLRDKLGTVLQEKCSFKSVSGINKAYKAAFGWAAKKTPQLQETKRLSVIEAKRHCIVHRGGRVDEKTASELKEFNLVQGQPLEWTPEEIREDLKLVLQRGLGLARDLHGLLTEVENHDGGS